MRHLDAFMIGIQDKVFSGDVIIKKMLGEMSGLVSNSSLILPGLRISFVFVVKHEPGKQLALTCESYVLPAENKLMSRALFVDKSSCTIDDEDDGNMMH